MLREELSDEIKSRQDKYGDVFAARFKQCLQRLSPALQNTTMFMGNAHMFIKPKLVDGSPNPLWPEGVDTPPRDEKERKEFYDKLREAHLADWLRRIKEGEFDRAPEIHADPDPDVEQRLSADDLDDAPETETVSADDFEEEVGELLEKHAEKHAEKKKEDTVLNEGASQEELDKVAEEAKEKIKPKRKARFGSDLANHQYPAGSHGSTLTGMLRCFVREVMVEEIDKLQGGITEQFDIDIAEKLEKENEALKSALLKLGKEVEELKKRADVAKKIIVSHNEQIKSLQQPKDGGVEGL